MLSATLVAGILSSGCFVLSTERRYRPDGPREFVKTTRHGEQLTYMQEFDSPDFNLEVGVEDDRGPWELDFLFDILPTPQRIGYLDSAPMRVSVHLRSKSGKIIFDPGAGVFCEHKQCAGAARERGGCMPAGPKMVWDERSTLD